MRKVGEELVVYALPYFLYNVLVRLVIVVII